MVDINNNNYLNNKNLSDIKKLRLMIKKLIDDIIERRDVIKSKYVEYVNQEYNDFFGLDSFHFQNKIINLEFKYLYKIYIILENRIYGDFYKLISIINKYLNKNICKDKYIKIKPLQHIKNYPIYKDLEINEKYDFNIISDIHQDIILIIETSYDIIKLNEADIVKLNKKIEMGYNIDNYVNNQKYKNKNLINTIDFYQSNLNVFHKYHNELLHNFKNKIVLFHKQVIPNSKEIIKKYTEELKIINTKDLKSTDVIDKTSSLDNLSDTIEEDDDSVNEFSDL